jgi:hypothetical protein
MGPHQGLPYLWLRPYGSSSVSWAALPEESTNLNRSRYMATLYGVRFQLTHASFTHNEHRVLDSRRSLFGHFYWYSVNAKYTALV